jgi:hypothetical protein
MKCKVHLCGSLEDFKPKFDKLKPKDQDWILNYPKPDGEPFKMNLSDAVRLLTMFNEVEKIYFEVR